MLYGPELKEEELSELLRGLSRWNRNQIAVLLKAQIRKRGNGLRYFDESGAEISLSEIHRRSQADDERRHRIYNLWMFYNR